MKSTIQTVIIAAAMALASSASAQETKTLPPMMGTVAPRPPVTPPANQSPRQRLEFLLSGYHYFPTKDDLARIGSDAEVAKLLRLIADDTNARVSMRTRAVDSMSYFNDDSSVGYLIHVMKRDAEAVDPANKRVTRSMKHHAITSLAKSLGKASVETLEYGLTHTDAQIRMTTISAIGKHAGEIGKKRLAKMTKSEKNPYVQKELRKYVGR